LRIARRPISLLAALPLLLAALCASAHGLRAQRLPSVQPGDRVRVTAPDLPKRVGTVVAVRADTLVFRARDADAPVPLHIPRLSLLQVPRGKHSPLRGLLIGTGAGAVAGYAAAALVAGEGCNSGVGNCGIERTFAALVVAAGSTVAGGIGGALVAADTERWATVPLTSLSSAGAVTLPAALPPGARVRVSAPGAPPVVAHVVGVRGDSLVLREPGGPGETVVALGAVRTVEVGRGGGRAASTRSGLILGTAAGALAFGAMGFASAGGDPQGPSRLVNAAWVGGILGVPLGAVVGGLAGHRRGALRWMPLPPVAGVAVAPGGEGGVAVGLTLPAR
jgi:hypothetical protein